MNKKGISVVSLSVMIVILLVIVSTISVSITYSIGNSKKLTFAKEIYNVQSLVTEYIQKENVLPVTTTTIQIEPSDLEQFPGEKVTGGKLILNVLDLTELDIVNTNYGNKRLGESNSEKEKDIYAVSADTGRVYYILGFKDSNKTYYTLTDDLLNMVDKKQDLLIGEKTILFIPNKLGWTSEAVTLKVSVPSGYEVTGINIDNNKISYTNETNQDFVYYNVNTNKVAEDYTITVKYVKNGVAGTVKYTTKLDNISPTITRDSSIKNTKTAIKGLKAIDEESGIKRFKYVEGIINDANAKDYVILYGKNLKKGSIKMKIKSIYTLYAEDKAGNYTVLHVDGDGERFYPVVATATGKNNLLLSNSYYWNAIDYILQGNSVQNGVPTPNAPVQIESVGNKISNILEYPYAETTKTEKGITWTDNGDGTITANGTATDDSYFGMPAAWYTWEGLTPGETYYFSGCPEGGSSTKYYMGIQNATLARHTIDTGKGNYYKADSEPVFFFLAVKKGTTVNNITFKPKLSKTRIANEDPESGYKIPIIVKGNSLLDYPYAETSKDKNGITWIDNGDGTITANGTATETSFFSLPTTTYDWEGLTPGKTYYFSGCPEGGSSSTYHIGIQDSTYSKISRDIGKGASYTANSNPVYFYLTVRKGVTVKDLTFSPILLDRPLTGDEQAYMRVYNIYLDEPLRKIGDYADYIDFKNQKIVRKVGEKRLTGEETFTLQDQGISSARVYMDLSDKNSANIGLSSHFQNMNDAEANVNTCDFKDLSFRVNVSQMNVTKVKDWTDYLQTQNSKETPVTILYPLATPKEQKINLPEIKLSYDSNVIIESTVAPSHTEITYYKKQ